MKASKRSNDKKVNLNLKDSTPNKDPRGSAKSGRPSLNITQWCLLAAFWGSWLNWLFGDGLTNNHNEMFLADVS
jgi:hypothetical protein